MGMGDPGSVNKARVFALHLLPEVVARRLDDSFAMVWNRGDGDLSVATLVERAGEFDGFLTTVTDRVPAEVFSAPQRRLRIVANYGVGVDLIDLEAARRGKVVVTNTPGVLTDCTADLTIALILMVLRRAGEGERLVREGRWTGWRPTQLLGRRAFGATLGVVGMGRIGQAVATRAFRGFGMKIRYHGRSRLPLELEERLGATWRSLDELLSESDIVTLHCPLTTETAGIIDARRIGLMRGDAIFINTARGALVDDAALADALRAGRLGGAGLDVYRNEPEVPAGLRELENVVLLPHLGSATRESRVAMGMMAFENLRRFFAGEPPPNRVV